MPRDPFRLVQGGRLYQCSPMTILHNYRSLTTATMACVLALTGSYPAFAQDNALQEAASAPQVEVDGAETGAVAEPAQSGGDAEQGVPALWKVADEDTTIYLFGTVHALPADTDWYRGALADALEESGELVTEIDSTPETIATLQQVIAERAMLQEGTLRALMDDEQRAIYEGAMQKLSLPAGSFDRFEPWFAALMLSNTALTSAGISPEAGVEKVLEGTAGADIARGALETAEFQMAIFDELPMESQIAFLIDGAQEIDNMAAQLQQMIDEWAVGDADGLAALLNDAFADDPVLADRLLYSRNANWAVWIDDRLDEPGTVFMAVGAGHLAGRNSVQELLAQRGITTLRVQ